MPRRYNLRQRDKNVKWVKDETLKEKEDESESESEDEDYEPPSEDEESEDEELDDEEGDVSLASSGTFLTSSAASIANDTAFLNFPIAVGAGGSVDSPGGDEDFLDLIFSDCLSTRSSCPISSTVFPTVAAYISWPRCAFSTGSSGSSCLVSRTV